MANYAIEYWIGTIKVREYRTAPTKEDAAVIAAGDVVMIEEIRDEFEDFMLDWAEMER